MKRPPHKVTSTVSAICFHRVAITQSWTENRGLGTRDPNLPPFVPSVTGSRLSINSTSEYCTRYRVSFDPHLSPCYVTRQRFKEGGGTVSLSTLTDLTLSFLSRFRATGDNTFETHACSVGCGI